MKKSFLKKVGLILCFGAFLILVDACHGANCHCPEITKEFFDFQSASIEVQRNSLDIPPNSIPSGVVANMSIILEDIEFLVQAEESTCHRPWFINSAFACSCLAEGNSGLKFPVTDVRVYSNADYSEEISAGELLNDIIKVNLPGAIEQGILSSVEDKNQIFSSYSNVLLFFDTPPTIDSTHTFTIEIVKNNGVTVSTESEVVTWL